jgi:hypothetical protein
MLDPTSHKTVRDRLKLSKLRAEHPMLTLIELIYVKKETRKTDARM